MGKRIAALALTVWLGCGGDEKAAGPELVSALGDLSRRAGKDIQAHGFVRPGSITSKIVDQQSVSTWVLEHQGAAVPVRLIGPKPDRLRDDAEMLVIGKVAMVDGAATIEATTVDLACDIPPGVADDLRPAWCLP